MKATAWWNIEQIEFVALLVEGKGNFVFIILLLLCATQRVQQKVLKMQTQKKQ